MKKIIGCVCLIGCLAFLAAADVGQTKWQYGYFRIAELGNGDAVCVWLSGSSQFSETDPSKLLADLEGQPVGKASDISILDYLGSQGWELVQRDRGDDLPKEKVYIFKRPSR